MDEVLLHHTETGIARLTLNRPGRRNAFTMETVALLSEMVTELSARDGTRAVVLTGAGGVFSAGGDLNWMRGVLRDPEGVARDGAERIVALLSEIDRLPCPVIARVDGAALGGGFGLVCAADIAIASGEARFGLTETRLGVVPGSISPFVLRRLGPAGARAIGLSGSTFGAATALRLGLVHHVVRPEDLDQAVDEVLASILRSSATAIARSKRLFREMAAASSERWIDLGLDAIVEAWRSDDAREGITAFLEKRPPAWSADG